MKPISILDVLLRTEQWLNWTRFFTPLSGHEAKLDDPLARYLATAFCYGCNLGPSQTARSLKGFDRRQVSWVNQHHITEEKLDEAIRAVITAYNRFHLPKYWGTGKRASADGTKWEMYEQNLLAEYHIRYGGYGGIGYYHVSDTYIALFSHFIPCGVHEGSYILDMFEKEEESVRPNTVHGDTHAQSTTVFGLAHLLGISLMPRIRNWKDLKLYRPDPEVHYTHLDSLFTDIIDWELIETHLPDMIRVALSIKAGKITPSTILRKLGTYSRKNKLYQAFQELGRVIRTHFLLHYLGDAELRSTIQSATNKSEAFNGFAKWAFFGGEGVITILAISLLAKMAATVDIIAHGRLNFGIGTGWSEREHLAYGIPLPPPGERIRRLGEACEMIRGLWIEPVVSFEGRYYQLREAPCEPKPIQKPHPPFVIGADGEQTLRVVARYANIWDCSVASPEEYRHKSAVLDSYCAAIGRDPATIERSRHISVDPSDLNAALLDTRTFIEVGATHIIYHVPVPDPLGILRRLAKEVAEPLRAEYQEAQEL